MAMGKLPIRIENGNYWGQSEVGKKNVRTREREREREGKFDATV